MWEKQIEKMKEEMAKWNTTSLNAPATDEEIKKFELAAKSALGVGIPEEHINFLKEINGLNYNGYFIYNIDEEFMDNELNQKVGGFIEANKEKSEYDEEKWIYIAESECWIYAYKVADKSYYQLDDVVGDVNKKYNSYVEMINEIINESLK